MELSITKDQTRSTVWNPFFIKIFIVNVLISFSIQAMNTLSATFADHLGASATVVGLVSSLFALTAMIFKVFSAPAIDTLNRKHILLGAIFVLLISAFGYAFTRTIPMLIIARLITGAGLAFTTTVCLTIASDALPPEKMSSGIGLFSLGSVIGQALGPTTGLKLVELLGYKQAFLLFALILVLALGITWAAKIKYTRNRMFVISLRGVIAREAFVPTVILFLLNSAYAVINAFLVLFATKQGVDSNIGFFFTVYALSMLVSRPIIGKLADKHGTLKILIPCVAIFALAFALISVSKGLPLLLVAGFVAAFGYGGCFPALLAAYMISVPPERRGAAISTAYIGLDLANLLGPVVAGSIIQGIGYPSMWRVMIVPIFIGGIVSFLFRAGISHTQPQPHARQTAASD